MNLQGEWVRTFLMFNELGRYCTKTLDLARQEDYVWNWCYFHLGNIIIFHQPPLEMIANLSHWTANSSLSCEWLEFHRFLPSNNILHFGFPTYEFEGLKLKYLLHHFIKSWLDRNWWLSYLIVFQCQEWIFSRSAKKSRAHQTFLSWIPHESLPQCSAQWKVGWTF